MEESKVQHYSGEVINRPPGIPPPYSSGPPSGPYPADAPGLHGTAPPVAVVGVAPNFSGTGPTMVPMVMVQQMGPKTTKVVCKSCHTEVMTRVEQKANTKTHLFAALLCMLGCWCCCCIPYCTDSCMNSEHYCPNCNAYIGNYSS